MSDKEPEVIHIGDQIPIHINPRLILIAALVLALAAWMVAGGPIYTVAPDEEGVVLTFGKYAKKTSPGLHFKFPWPVQTVETPKVTEVKRLEFGFRTVTQGGTTGYRDFTDNRSLLHEAQMLTGDENVVNISMAVQYQISDSLKYLFNFSSPEAVELALRDIGEAALRQAVGDRPIDHGLTTKKDQIQIEIRQKMTELVSLYELGVTITAVQLQDVKPPGEVAAAFQEVASAREERERIINVSRGYERETIPTAEGEAQRMILEAEAYKEARVAEAHGEVARFVALMREYNASPEVTRIRLYLEAMEELLPKLRITVIDESASLVNLKSLTGAPIPEPPPGGSSGASTIFNSGTRVQQGGQR